MISAALESFARLLGIKDDQAEDALTSERVARHVTRRGFLGAAGALVGGTLFSFGTEEPRTLFLREDGTWHGGSSLTRFDAFLKERYSADRVEELVWRGDPFFALLPISAHPGALVVSPAVHQKMQGLLGT